MRIEAEIMNLILNFAEANEFIRAVWMNGSRVNPHVIKDELQDYDVAFVANEIKHFLEDKSWIAKFGKTIIIQEPDKNDAAFGIKHNSLDTYTFLMLFEDGNRIDLKFINKNYAIEEYKSDSLTVLLLDKDKFLPELPPLSDIGYYIEKPTQAQFLACQNEFWWCLQNIAKGIVRDELPCAMKIFNICHEELEKMVEWYIGIQNNFEVSTGKFGKYFNKYLPGNFYKLYEKTYLDSNCEHLWNAIFAMCDLFRLLAKEVAKKLGFNYNKNEEDGMIKYLTKFKSKDLNYENKL